MSKRSSIEKIYEILYLAFLALITFAGFLNTTMFPYRFSKRSMLVISICLFVVICVFSVLRKISWRDGKFICAAAVCLLMFISWKQTGHGFLLELALLVLGAYGISFRHILKTYLGISLPFFAVTIAAALTGRIENLVYYRGDQIRIAFGIHYPTDFAAHVFFLICCWVWLRNRAVTWAEGAGILVIGCFCAQYCGARTTAVCLALMFFLLAGILFLNAEDARTGREVISAFRRPVRFLLFLAVPFSCLASLVLSRFYRDDRRLLVRLDHILHNRLSLGRTGFERYPVKAFGQVIRMQGSGGSTESVEDYFFLDSSYMYILMCLGVCVLLAVMMILIREAAADYRSAEWIWLTVLSCICLECFMEHHLITIGYHPFLLLLAADAGTAAGGKLLPERKKAPERENAEQGTGMP